MHLTFVVKPIRWESQTLSQVKQRLCVK